MRARDAVISRPTGVPPLRRGFFAAITAAAWTVFLWLAAPLITVGLWALGLTTAYQEAIARLGDVSVELLVVVLGLSVALAVVLVGWAELQRHRFVGHERRRRPDDVTLAEVATALHASDDVVAALRAHRVTVLTLDDAARPVAVRAVPVVPGTPALTGGLTSVPAQHGAAEEAATTCRLEAVPTTPGSR